VAGHRPVKVRCPGCDEHLTGQAKIVAVRRDSRSVVVTVEVPPIPHSCGAESRAAVGFRPNPSGGTREP
jgi:hypothetical protein